MVEQDLSVLESIEQVDQTGIVPMILEIICHTTGLRFAAVARVTPERWIACGVRDEINFGLRAGGELKVDSTICHEIRQSGTEVLIDDVRLDIYYCTHHTPALYGFRSYISVPIWLKEKQFFGTLCAIDPNPALLNNTPIRNLFKIYASLIGFLIDANTLLPTHKSEQLRQRCIMSLRTHVHTMTGTGVEEQMSHIAIGSKKLVATQTITTEIDRLKLLLESLQESM